MLAGGFGTRLRPLSCTRPKTLFPIVNKPLLQWIFERLAKNNIKEAILAVNLQTEFYIKRQRIPKNGLRVKYSIDPPKKPLGTAGPVKKAQKLLGNSEPFLVLNGDIFENVNYSEIIEEHKKNQALATIALCEVEDPSRYGVAELADDNRITRFIEKPAKGTAPTNLINAGIYVLSPEIFTLIPKGKKISMEREIFPKLAQQGKLFGHIIRGIWIDIGKPEEYLQTNKIILDTLGKTHRIRTGKFEIKKPVAFDKGVSIGEKSVIGPYAIFGKNVTIGKNVHISDTVIFPDAQIDDYAIINGAIIGEGAVIGKKVQISKGCIVADQAKIRDNITLPAEAAVCPAKEVSENILKSKIIC
ncbi:MAG: NDP-sugar synthase [Candidatus Bathyarchaeota archaeon]|nr:NDP-sugar synthase [Candidatus Bathyarchaeota archaeon]